jgi:hypothetical protein
MSAEFRIPISRTGPKDQNGFVLWQYDSNKEPDLLDNLFRNRWRILIRLCRSLSNGGATDAEGYRLPYHVHYRLDGEEPQAIICANPYKMDGCPLRKWAEDHPRRVRGFYWERDHRSKLTRKAKSKCTTQRAPSLPKPTLDKIRLQIAKLQRQRLDLLATKKQHAERRSLFALPLSDKKEWSALGATFRDNREKRRQVGLCLARIFAQAGKPSDLGWENLTRSDWKQLDSVFGHRVKRMSELRSHFRELGPLDYIKRQALDEFERHWELRPDGYWPQVESSYLLETLWDLHNWHEMESLSRPPTSAASGTVS